MSKTYSKSYKIMWELYNNIIRDRTHLLVGTDATAKSSFAFLVLRFLGLSMGQTTNERIIQSDGKWDLASLFIIVQP